MIIVTVDRLSKGLYISNVHSTIGVANLAQVFVREVQRYHGLPDSIISNRGTLFVSELQKAINHRLGINLDFTSTYYPESDRQTKRYNATIEEYLRQYVNVQQDDQAAQTPLAEFALINAVSSATSITLFFANHGFYLRIAFGPPRTIYTAALRHVKKINS